MGLKNSLTLLAIAAALSGCASDGTGTATPDPAPVVTAADSGATSTGTSTQDVTGDPIAPVIAGSADGEGAGYLKRSVYYEFDKYDVKPGYRPLVERHAAWLRSNPKARLVITGNTDEHGPSSYNLALGQKRAESVARLMVLLGAKPDQIEAVSFGKEKPRALGHDEASWAENRRADFGRP